MHRFVGRSAASVQVEGLRSLIGRQDVIEVSVAEEDPSAKEVVRRLFGELRNAVN